jgi:hypothetical protein
MIMAVSTVPIAKPSAFSVVFVSVVRVLFATLLFTAGGMGVGLFLGILGTVAWGAIHGGRIDMRNAYLHVAIPCAILTGTTALVGMIFLEVRARRTSANR